MPGREWHIRDVGVVAIYGGAYLHAFVVRRSSVLNFRIEDPRLCRVQALGQSLFAILLGKVAGIRAARRRVLKEGAREQETRKVAQTI